MRAYHYFVGGILSRFAIIGDVSVGDERPVIKGGRMPRDNPKGALVNEIALLSEEIDRLERYLREPESLQARVQELIAQRAEL